MKVTPGNMISFGFAAMINVIFMMVIGQTVKPYYSPLQQVAVGMVLMLLAGILIAFITKVFMNLFREKRFPEQSLNQPPKEKTNH